MPLAFFQTLIKSLDHIRVQLYGVATSRYCKYAFSADTDLADIININIFQLANTFPHYVDIKKSIHKHYVI